MLIRRAAVIAAAVAATLALASPASAIGISWGPGGNYFGVVTQAGVYYIAVRCFNEAPTPNRARPGHGQLRQHRRARLRLRRGRR